jgi:hypothetical protein
MPLPARLGRLNGLFRKGSIFPKSYRPTSRKNLLDLPTRSGTMENDPPSRSKKLEGPASRLALPAFEGSGTSRSGV